MKYLRKKKTTVTHKNIKMSEEDRMKNGFSWKPFGGWDYGYPEMYMVYGSWSIWAMVTWGSFFIDPLEAAALLGAGFYLAEHPQMIPGMDRSDDVTWGAGSSYVHNLQAGYCWYHYFFKGRREWPVFMGTWSELAGDAWAVVEEMQEEHPMYAHDAHYMGAFLGLASAWLLDMVRPHKKGRPFSALLLGVPALTLGLMYWQQQKKESDPSYPRGGRTEELAPNYNPRGGRTDEWLEWRKRRGVPDFEKDLARWTRRRLFVA